MQGHELAQLRAGPETRKDAMTSKDKRPPRRVSKPPATRRNPDPELPPVEDVRRRNPPPKTSVAEVAAQAGLVSPNGAPLVDLATRFLNLLELGIRFDPRSGEARIIAKDRDRGLDALALLQATAACMVWPGAAADYWTSCPAAPGTRRNPFVGVSLDSACGEQGGGEEFLEDDDDDYLDDEELD